jgi:hypothetical protein
MNDKGDNDTPDWVKQSNAAKKKEKEQSERQARQSLEASEMVTSNALGVWQRFVKELGIQAKAVSKLEGEELVGFSSPTGQPGGPTSCVVDVNRQSVSRGPYLGRVVFHHDSPGSNIVRVTRQGEKEDELRLRLDPDDKVCFRYHDRLFSPEKMAETVIQQMADAAKRG